MKKVGEVGGVSVDAAKSAGNASKRSWDTSAQRPTLTVSALATALGVAPRTVRDWLAAGRVDGVRTPGGHWRIPRAELERLLGTARPELLARTA